MNGDVRAFVKMMGHKNETEFRAIDPTKKKPPVQKWVKPNELEKLVHEYDGAYNCYAGLNERVQNGDSDDDVLVVDKFFLDIDAIHPKNEPASDKELDDAKEVTDAIAKEFEERGYGRPTIAMSGNGFQIVARTRPLKTPSRLLEEKIKALEKEFIEKYSGEKAKIDVVGNRSRIIKIWGTTSIKGEESPTRPHRRSYVLEYHDEPSEQLRDDILFMETRKPQLVYLETPPIARSQNDIVTIASRDEKLKRLLDGNESGYTSTSEAEQALLSKLVYYNFSDPEIDAIMTTHSRLDKWRTASKSYKTLSLKKAHEFVTEKREVRVINENENVPQTSIPVKPSLTDVHDTFRKWICFKDTDRIDAVLAVASTRASKGTRLWLVVVGASGDWKSEQLSAIEDPQFSKLVGRITPRTFITGNPKAEDLAPKLDQKILLIKDMAQIMTLTSEDKAAIWAQLRDMYDGKMVLAAGSGVDKTIDLNVTMIAASTPVIDEQILQGAALGTRELVYRTSERTARGVIKENETTEELNETMNKALENESHKEQMALELKTVCTRFLKNIQYKDVAIPQEVLDELKKKAMFIRLMRTVGESDYEGNLRNAVYPEKPTRILMQLKKFYMALKGLDEGYSDKRALRIIEHIANSASHPIRLKILDVLKTDCKDAPHTVNFIAAQTGVGYKSANLHLNVLEHIGYAKKQYSEETNNFGKVIEKTLFEFAQPNEFEIPRKNTLSHYSEQEK